MEVKEHFAVQQKLGSELERYFIFPEGTVIWPEHSGRGVLTEDLQAEKLNDNKVRELQAWRAERKIHLYLDQRHWQLSSGTRFGAPERSARRRTLRNK